MKTGHKLFLGFLALGVVFIMADEVWRWKNREKFDYVDVKIWIDGRYISETLKSKEKERIKKLVEDLAESGKAVWFGAPRLYNCILELWDAWKEEFYFVCRGKDGKWYVQLPGSSRGRSTERYFEIKEEEAKEIIRRIQNKLL